MHRVRILAAALMIAGVASTTYGATALSHRTKVAQLGPLALSARTRRHIDWPLWVGAGMIVAGGFLWVARGRRR